MQELETHLDFVFDNSAKEEIAKPSSKFEPSYWRQISQEKRFPEEYWDAISRSGLFGMIIEKKYGGLERGILDLILAVQETAERYAGLASYLFLSGCLVSKIFSQNGNEVQKRELLPRLAKGEVKISLALSEENSGLDTRSIETKATRISETDYVLNGSKAFVNNIDRAEYLIVFARTKSLEETKKKSLGLTMFLVPAREDDHLHSTKLEKLGMDFVNNFSLEINDLKVDKSQIIGEPEKAWYNIIEILNLDRVATAASLVGTGELALAQASDWARKRKVFGKAIGSNQGIQFPLAESFAQLEAAETMTLKAASLANQGRDFASEASFALLSASTAAAAATDRALQTLGGHGYFKDYDVERYWRDVRVHKVHPITEELLLASIAERSLGLTRSY